MTCENTTSIKLMCLHSMFAPKVISAKNVITVMFNNVRSGVCHLFKKKSRPCMMLCIPNNGIKPNWL